MNFKHELPHVAPRPPALTIELCRRLRRGLDALTHEDLAEAISAALDSHSPIYVDMCWELFTHDRLGYVVTRNPITQGIHLLMRAEHYVMAAEGASAERDGIARAAGEVT